MTVEEFEQRMDEIGNHFLGMASTPLAEVAIKNAVLSLVHQHYAEGGYILDRVDNPILSMDDIEIIVTRTSHMLTAVAVRRNFDPFKK